MWSKIYIGVLALSIAAMGFFTYYSWSWLQSIGLPASAIEGYQYHSGLARNVLWVSIVFLLVLGNAVLWASGRAWAMWATFLYFATFVVIRYFWLDRTFVEFGKSNGLIDGSQYFGPFFGAVLITLTAAFVFADQFTVVRLQQRMYPTVPPPEPEPPTESAPD